MHLYADFGPSFVWFHGLKSIMLFNPFSFFGVVLCDVSHWFLAGA
ncbi:hypothetical protein MIZ03_2132 [Rhodoferax lithotrophicus]|uniref:Uncharacterized protein n=1 Tax=Rhodoferax lithotrophicus TaxID=2798804 RepID=A0ABN6D8Q1_9BURK|nr:hypothetical protein MIZ03_2132 [Rhodoferax sp. MIZ03]